MRRLACWFAFLLLAPLPAQDDPVDIAIAQLVKDVTPRLASDDAKEVAWGAHLVSRFELPGTSTLLQDALRRWRDREGDDARQVRMHLADALWATKATLPVAEYEFLLEDPLTRVAAFLIAARDVPGNCDLLARLATQRIQPNDLVPFAAGGLLVDKDVRAPAFATHLLQVAKAQLTVRVVDGQQYEPTVESWSSCSWPDWWRATAGFPPFVLHELRRFDPGEPTIGGDVVRAGLARDAVILASDGKNKHPLPLPNGGRVVDRAVLHKRTVSTRIDRRKLLTCPPAQEPDVDQACLWLERMARMNLPSSTEREVHWTNEADLRATIDRAKQEIQAAAQPLVERLIGAKWLQADDAKDYHLPVHVNVWDERGDQSVPLPKIDDR